METPQSAPKPRILGERNWSVKHPISVSEIISRKEKKKKRARTKPKRVPLNEFEIKTTEKLLWLGSDFSGTIIPSKRNPLLLDLFHDLFPEEVFECLIEDYNSTKGKEKHSIT